MQDNYTISKLKEKLYNACFHFDTNSNSHIYNRRFYGLLLCQWKYFGTNVISSYSLLYVADRDSSEIV